MVSTGKSSTLVPQLDPSRRYEKKCDGLVQMHLHISFLRNICQSHVDYGSESAAVPEIMPTIPKFVICILYRNENCVR
jgi:hypothetical protein